MPALLFDTLRLSQTLRDKGHFTPEQAEVLAEAFSLATHEDLATKADIAEIKIEIADLKASVAAVKAEILKWIVGAIGFQTCWEQLSASSRFFAKLNSLSRFWPS